jgi:hypothetical protein
MAFFISLDFSNTSTDLHHFWTLQKFKMSIHNPVVFISCNKSFQFINKYFKYKCGRRTANPRRDVMIFKSKLQLLFHGIFTLPVCSISLCSKRQKTTFIYHPVHRCCQKSIVGFENLSIVDFKRWILILLNLYYWKLIQNSLTEIVPFKVFKMVSALKTATRWHAIELIITV